MSKIPIIEMRRIEAMILAHVHKILTERHGREEADTVVGETCSRSAIDQGKMMADQLDHTPNYDDFVDLLPRWTAEDALTIDMVEQDPEKMSFNVTRCRYAEMYHEMGLGKIGHLLSCNRDGDFCKGFNPDMHLDRSQTIMSGAKICDFRFSMKSNRENTPDTKGQDSTKKS